MGKYAPQTTVQAAADQIAAMTGDERRVALLAEACLNAEAAFQMLGFKPAKGRGFRPVGVMSLMGIQDALATIPEQAALVRTSMAFACECCGMPAESGNDDCWTCDACAAQDTEGGE